MWARDCGSPAGLGSLCRRCFLCLGVGEEGLAEGLAFALLGSVKPYNHTQAGKAGGAIPGRVQVHMDGRNRRQRHSGKI